MFIILLFWFHTFSERVEASTELLSHVRRKLGGALGCLTPGSLGSF
jgi:hypothetical protein